MHVLHTVAYGGVETIILNWLRMLDPVRFSVHLVCFANPDGSEEPFLAAARREGIDVHLLRWTRWKPVLRASRDLTRFLREVGADIVHTHNVYADLVGLLSARTVGAKVVCSLFVWGDFGWKRNLLQSLDAWALRRFDFITAQCEQTRRDSIARGLPADRTRVVISGFGAPPPPPSAEDRDARRKDMGIEPGQVVLANVARLYPEKAQDLLLQAFAAIYARHPGTRLWIFGTGPLESSLRSLCVSLNLEACVRFIGFADDLLTVLPFLDVQVHPSHGEGVPMALCSGLAAGLPIVASSVGGVPEVLDEGRGGILVPPAGAPDFHSRFVDEVSALVADGTKRRLVGDAGRRFLATSYSLETAAVQLEQVYSTVRAS